MNRFCLIAIITGLIPCLLLAIHQGNRHIIYLEEKRNLMHLRHERERREECAYLRRYAEEYALACIASGGRKGWQKVGELASFISQDGGFIHPDDPRYPFLSDLKSMPLYAVRINFKKQRYAFFVNCGDEGVRLIPTEGGEAYMGGERWSFEEIEESLVAMDALAGVA